MIWIIFYLFIFTTVVALIEHAQYIGEFIRDNLGAFLANYLGVADILPRLKSWGSRLTA